MVKSKVIRDAVHGDIFIQDKYVKVIDTPEFQRLRRIKQLSVGNLAFPCAEHTRFSHSIGTFYVTGKIIEHFNKIFNIMQLDSITEDEKEATLLAALLHDIGHGPFSHTFEKVLHSQNYDISHEKMSIDIITNSNTEIYKVLCNEFDTDFPNRIADIIQKKRNIKEKGFDKTNSKPDLSFVLSSLISSQLDADRIDYLLRDALFTGVKFGNIDLSRIISSMTLSVNRNDEFCVCVKAKYLSDIESYLAGRYQMHKSVYYHSLKCQMELVVKKILVRAKYLVVNNKLDKVRIPDAIISLFEGREINIEEYLSLDDNLLYSLFVMWKDSDDIELSYLCNTILNRKKFKKITIMLTEKYDYISEFKYELNEIFKVYGYNINLDNENFLLEIQDKYSIYKISKDNIYILDQFGILRDITEESKLINISINENKNTIFISFELLERLYIKEEDKKMISDIEKLIYKHDSRNHIEIEKKYFVKDEIKVQNIIDVIDLMDKYVVNSGSNKMQIDYYYDTEDYLFKKSNITVRIRESGDSYILTIKTPVIQKVNEKEVLLNERFEHEYKVNTKDIGLNTDLICKHINKDEIDISNLKETLIVNNNRTKYNILEKASSKLMFEMVYDDVKYVNINNSKIANDKQIEIEMKSDYDYAVNLKILTDFINKNVPDLEEDVVSKYKRGLELTK